MKKNLWGLASLLLALCAPVAAQQGSASEESQGEPGDLPTIHVPTETDLPDAPGLDYQFTALLQGDGLAWSEITGGNGDPEQIDHKDAKLRRARVAALLRYNLNWRFKASADFANKPYLREVSLEYRDGPLALEAGRIVEPFGVLAGGSTSMALMERPVAEGLAPGYGLGVAANAHGERWGLTLGVFESTQNNVQEGGRKERAVTLRPTFAPLHKENQVIHLGIEASYRETKDGPLQFVAIPESVLLYGMNIRSAPLFTDQDTGRKNKYQLFGLELGMLFGPVMILTEGTFAHVADAFNYNGNFGGFNFNYSQDAWFTGYYLEADWSLTGERRDYSVRRGAFSGLDPNTSVLKGGRGAWEIGARVGAIDLEDQNLGGEAGAAFSLGVNWYPEEHTRVTLEGVSVHKSGFSDPAFDRDAQAIQMRVQTQFSAS